MAKKVKIELDYDIGDTVFLKTDPEQFERMVVSVLLLPAGLAMYSVVCGEVESDHYGIELSDKARVE